MKTAGFELLTGLWHFFEAWPLYRLMAALLVAATVVSWKTSGRSTVDPRIWAWGSWSLIGLVYPYLPGYQGVVAFSFCLLLTALTVGATEEPWTKPDLLRGAGTVAQKIWLAGIFAAFLFLTFWNLNNFSGRGSLMTWEFSVVADFADRWKAGDTVWQGFLHRLSWSEGLVSEGEGSFFYGAPTYALLTWVGFHPWTLRIVAVLLAVAGLGVAARLAQRHMGQRYFLAVAVLLATEPHYAFAAHYGTLLSATFLSTFLGWAAVGALLEHRRFHAGSAVLAALALYGATLHYAPGRLGVLLVLGFLGILMVIAIARRDRARWQNVGLLFLCAGGLVFWQIRTGHGPEFYSARGEQVLRMAEEKSYLEDFLHRPVDLKMVDWKTKVEFGLRMMQRHAEALPFFFTPATGTSEPGLGTILSDPPRLPLWNAALVPLVAFGFFRCARGRRGLLGMGLLWLGAFGGSMLLTTRVDSFRLILAPLPLLVWAAVGVNELFPFEEKKAALRWIQHILFFLGAALFLGHTFLLQYSVRPPDSVFSQEMAPMLRDLPGGSLVGFDGGAPQRSWMHLILLEQARSQHASPAEFLEPADDFLFRLSDTIPTTVDLRHFLIRTQSPPVFLLAPAAAWRGLTAGLREVGYTIQRKELTSDAIILATRPPDFKPQTVRVAPPAPPVFSPKSRRISLTGLHPIHIEYGLNEPSLNKDCDGGPISLGRKEYADGIGVHAWTKMTFRVPEDAIGFESIAGLCDRVRDNHRADVEFQLVDETGKMLYDSGLVTNPDDPIHIAAPLSKVKELTLVVTEGMNGRDSDHADWAEPHFVLSEER